MKYCFHFISSQALLSDHHKIYFKRNQNILFNGNKNRDVYISNPPPPARKRQVIKKTFGKATKASPAKPGRFLAWLCLVVGEDVGSVEPLGIVVQQRPLLVEAVGPRPVVFHVPVLDSLHLPETIKC